ncbi:TRAP transporter permease [Microaerobacter geothermalis]|uniref:TRAP transporter permease n=1 Tax=Microaerobacter geothermalis TaxID=674972 RepID=UPI001F1CA9CC|nr:TRAP transporter permease [Microaerobacter geothermalis]MCF6094583.1 TRAP transporter permease [Microaerobacter geothermalis]
MSLKPHKNHHKATENTQQPEQKDHLKLLEKLDNEFRYRQFHSGPWKFIISLLAISLAAYQLYTAYMGPLDALKHRSLHIGVIMALVFLLYPAYKRASRTKMSVIDVIFALLSLSITGYIFVDYQGIIDRMFIFAPNFWDLFFGGLLILLVLEGSRRIIGWALTIISILFLLYAYFGNYMPGLLKHSGKPLEELIAYMYLTTEGIYGTALAVSASYIILFILFGAFLNRSGMGQFFNDVAMGMAGGSTGGPAKVAVISSGFLGSINGSALANVVTTGAFTIPMMKRVGYRPEFAGAVEAAASVGGQIIPPVMGAAAFIMAETLGKPYSEIAIAAILPAVLYYLGVIMIVHLRAKRRGLLGLPKEELPNLKRVILTSGHLLIPIVVLIYLLFTGRTPIFAAFFAIVLSVVVAAFSKKTRMGIRDILKAMEDGVRAALSVAMSTAIVGIIVGVTTLTGLGAKLTQSILVLGQGSLFLTLIYTMIASMIMGMGLPSIPTYIITSTLAAPALLQMGVPPFVSHMFVFYFGIFANITPPVALAAFAGAGISGGDPNKTGIQALRLALAGFIVPYVFVYSNELLLQDLSHWTETLWVMVTSIIGVIALSAAVEGYYKSQIPILLRLIATAGALTLIVPGMITDIIGFALLGIVAIQQYWKNPKQNIQIKEGI